MKRIQHFLFFVVCLFVSNQLFAQQVNEDFEGTAFPPAGWTTAHVTGTISWERSSVKGSPGNHSAFINYEPVPPQIADNWLISPKVYHIQAGDNIDFDLATQFAQNAPADTLYIMVSTMGNQVADFTHEVLKITMDVNSSLAFVHKTVSLAAFVGQNIYVGFRNYSDFGNGLYIDNVQIGSNLPNDIATTQVAVNPGGVVATLTAVSIKQTVKNVGSDNIAVGTPVKYTVNGTLVGSGTLPAIDPGNTTTFNFTGGNAFIPSIPGDYLIKVFTDLPGELNRSNDTVSFLLKVQTPIATYPYFEDFESQNGWTQSGNALWTYQNQLYGNDVINPSGKVGTAVKATFYSISSGKTLVLSSPLFNFSTVSKPMVNFYVAKGQGPLSENDKFEVLVSLDGGVTYEAAPVLYRKAFTTDPKLESMGKAIAGFEYYPKSAVDWRHEIVDLSAYAGQPHVMIVFKGTSGVGNNLWLDDVNVINQDPALYKAARVTAPSQVVTGPFNSKITFHTVPSADSIRMQGHNTQPAASPFATNTTATSGDGTTSQPDFVFNRFQTIAFSGNSIVRANYDVSLDITGLTGLADSGKLYILKRADETGDWVALPTTRSGSVLTATGLTKFSDFAIGGKSSVVPLKLVSLSGVIRNGESLLDWQTAQEENVSGFEVERKAGSQWTTLGTVPALNSTAGYHYYFTDRNPKAGENLYRLRMVDMDGTFSYSRIVSLNNNQIMNRVLQNVPNPFASITLIKYFVSARSNVKIAIYNTAGAQVDILENSVKGPGMYEVRWNAGNRPAGTYFYRVIIGNDVMTKQMIKIK